jgi:hypothetical protein
LVFTLDQHLEWYTWSPPSSRYQLTLAINNFWSLVAGN